MKTFDFTTGANSSLALSQKYLTELFDQRKFITVEEIDENRNEYQNRLYWFWLSIISKATFHKYGMTKNDWHEFFKRKFLGMPMHVIEINSQVYEIIKSLSTTELSKSDLFPGYLKEIELFVKVDLANEGFEIYLPSRKDKDIKKLYEKYGNN